jgi:hypothetical protein
MAGLSTSQGSKQPAGSLRRIYPQTSLDLFKVNLGKLASYHFVYQFERSQSSDTGRAYMEPSCFLGATSQQHC